MFQIKDDYFKSKHDPKVNSTPSETSSDMKSESTEVIHQLLVPDNMDKQPVSQPGSWLKKKDDLDSQEEIFNHASGMGQNPTRSESMRRKRPTQTNTAQLIKTSESATALMAQTADDVDLRMDRQTLGVFLETS